jgi:hypothetical protein
MGFFEADRVEGFTRRFYAHFGLHPLDAVVLHGESVSDDLGDRLDSERQLGVARLIDMAVDGGDRDAEPVGVRMGEFRDITGDLAAAHRSQFGAEFLQIVR